MIPGLSLGQSKRKVIVSNQKNLWLITTCDMKNIYSYLFNLAKKDLNELSDEKWSETN